MKKKIIIFLLIITGLIIISYTGWIIYQEAKKEKEGLVKYEHEKYYIIKDTPEGKIVENKHAGLSFKVPNNWKIKKPPTGILDVIRLYSPNSEEKNGIIMKTGCRIIPEISYVNTDISTIKKELSHNSIWSKYIVKTTNIKIKDYQGLKYVAESSELKFHHIGIILPAKDKVYSFSIDSNLEERTICSQLFDKFLKTVLIE